MQMDQIWYMGPMIFQIFYGILHRKGVHHLRRVSLFSVRPGAHAVVLPFDVDIRLEDWAGFGKGCDLFIQTSVNSCVYLGYSLKPWFRNERVAESHQDQQIPRFKKIRLKSVKMVKVTNGCPVKLY